MIEHEEFFRSCLGHHKTALFCFLNTLQYLQCVDSQWKGTSGQQVGHDKPPNLCATTSLLYAPTINISSGSREQVEEEERSKWVGINQMW